MAPMRIALLSYEYPPDTGFGGIGTYSYYHARALAKLGHEVHVIAGSVTNGVYHSEHDGVKVIRIKREVTLEEGDKKATFLPFEGFKVSFGIDFDHDPKDGHKSQTDPPETLTLDEVFDLDDARQVALREDLRLHQPDIWHMLQNKVQGRYYRYKHKVNAQLRVLKTRIT